jgi:hypothetical protein
VKLLEEVYLYLLTNTANLLSYNQLKRVFKMGLDTAREYISHGISSYLFFEHRYFSYSLKESYERNRKIYAVDTGLRNAVSFLFFEDWGRLAETVVFMECKRYQQETYYYQEKQEIDFVIKHSDRKLTAMNVCYGDTVPPREIQALEGFRVHFKQRVQACRIITKDYEEIQKGIEFIPLWKWLLLAPEEKF